MKKKTARLKMSEDGIDIGIPVQICKESNTGLFIASCQVLNLITQGNSIQDAKINFEEVLDIFVEEYCSEPDKLRNYLLACGWELTSKKSMMNKIKSLALSSLVNSSVKIESLNLPISVIGHR